MARGVAPLALRACLLFLRGAALLVPRGQRAAWVLEWEAEVRHRWQRLERRGRVGRQAQLDILRRSAGALPDAAWLRRQVTADADFVHDARHALRLLRRDVGFAATVVCVLGLGLAGATAVFSLAEAVLWRPLPLRDPDRVVTVWQTNAREGLERDDVSPANFLDWRERVRSIRPLAAAVPAAYDLSEGAEPEVVLAMRVTEGFFEALGARAARGRLFRPDENEHGRHRVAVLTDAVWRRFGADPGLVGREIRLDGEPFTVVGVLPPDFVLGLLPARTERGLFTPYVLQDRDRRVRGSAWWNAVGRLAPGVSLDEAAAELASVAAALAREHPRTNTGVDARLIPLRDHFAGPARPALVTLAVAVALVLAVTWANVSGLLLARGAERASELAVRAALGAGRGRLVRQLLAESVLLAGLGCGLGLALAHWVVRAVAAARPLDAPGLGQAGINGAVLAFTGGLTVVTALAAGLLPALRLSRRDVERSLRQAGRRALGSRGGQRVRRGLVVAQVAAALVLLSGAALLTRSLVALLRTDPGFGRARVLVLQASAGDRNRTPEARAAFFAETIERIAALPDIEALGAVSSLPLLGTSVNMRSTVLVEGRPAPTPGDEGSSYVTLATPGYFEAMGIRLLRGRSFGEHDRGGRPAVALVNEALARREWGDDDPLGRAIALRLSGQPVRAEVIGVVAAARQSRLERAADPEVFLPHAQFPFGAMTYVVRTRTEPARALAAVKERIRAVDPLQAFHTTATLDDLVAAATAHRRFLLTVVAAFAALAVLLAAVGLAGLLRFLVAQQAPEIGVRLALGAEQRDIVRLVVGHGMGPIVAGLALGLLASLGLRRALAGMLYGVSHTDPVALGGACGLLALVAAIACYLPARRASRLDPLASLRAE